MFRFLMLIFIELASDPTIKNLFQSIPLEEFWMKARNEYAELSVKAVNKLLLFSTTYLSEYAFSAMAMIKTKYRNRMNAENAMILAITNIQPRIDELSKSVHRRKQTFN